jgi:hypothetical protein
VTTLAELALPELYRVIQGFAEKKVSVLMVSGVSFGENDNGFREVEFLHVTVELRPIVVAPRQVVNRKGLPDDETNNGNM